MPINKLRLIISAVIGVVASISSYAGGFGNLQLDQETTIVYDDVIFFDGYRTFETLKEESKALIPENDGILRIKTSLYSVKLTDEQLNKIGKSFSFKVELGALCDNYDRIGNINLAFVPKGQDSYQPEDVSRIEIGRFITPFMNMNYEPTLVPYTFDMNELSLIFHDKNIRDNSDIWVEFELFGVPYAANTEVRGCAGREDVFSGTLTFITDKGDSNLIESNVLIPIVMKKQEGGNFNNYQEGCTDELGKTIKTWSYNLKEDVEDAQIVLIISNHGANSGGEEYNRREHFVYVDGELATVFVPGRSSCEPFRQYNTQSNGIYGYSTMSDSQWQSFSNWCPGDKIDNRVIRIGRLTKGEHSITINVPDAKFKGKQGDFPVSMYFQGTRTGNLPGASIDQIVSDHRSSFKISKGQCTVVSDESVRQILLFNVKGEIVNTVLGSKKLSFAKGIRGVHVFAVEYEDGLIEYHKVML